MALSSIPASEMIAELAANEGFAALSQSEQIDLINSASQEVCNIYYLNGRSDYKGTNLASPLSSISVGVDVRRGFGSASIDGTFVPFSSPLSTPYMLPKLFGYKDGQEHGVSFFNPITGADTRTVSGFTAFSDVNGVTVEFEANKPI